MEKSSSSVIRVKSKYANQFKSLITVDKFLSTVKFCRVDDLQDDNVSFWIKFSDDSSTCSVSELQVRNCFAVIFTC